MLAVHGSVASQGGITYPEMLLCGRGYNWNSGAGFVDAYDIDGNLLWTSPQLATLPMEILGDPSTGNILVHTSNGITLLSNEGKFITKYEVASDEYISCNGGMFLFGGYLYYGAGNYVRKLNPTTLALINSYYNADGIRMIFTNGTTINVVSDDPELFSLTTALVQIGDKLGNLSGYMTGLVYSNSIMWITSYSTSSGSGSWAAVSYPGVSWLKSAELSSSDVYCTILANGNPMFTTPTTTRTYTKAYNHTTFASVLSDFIDPGLVYNSQIVVDGDDYIYAIHGTTLSKYLPLSELSLDSDIWSITLASPYPNNNEHRYLAYFKISN